MFENSFIMINGKKAIILLYESFYDTSCNFYFENPINCQQQQIPGSSYIAKAQCVPQKLPEFYSCSIVSKAIEL